MAQIDERSFSTLLAMIEAGDEWVKRILVLFQEN
jgi:hypothetical protein